MKKLCIFLLISFCVFGAKVKAQCPTFSISAPQGTVVGCVPLTLSLTAVNTSTLSSVTYTWTDPSLATSTGSTIMAGAGVYTVDAKDASSSCIVTNTISISQNTVAPGCIVTPSSAVVGCTNTSVTFTATSSSTTNIVGQWYDPFNAPMAPFLSGTPLIASMYAPGTYSVTFTDIANGCTSSQTVAVMPTTLAIPGITISPVTTSLTCSASPVPVTLTANSDPNTIGAWYHYNIPVTAPGNSSVNYITANPTTYTVVFTNTVTGCMNYSTVAVPSNSIVNSITVTASSYSLSCANGTSSLSVNLNFWAAPPFSITYTNVATSATLGVGPYVVNSPGLYICGVNDGNNCMVTQQIYIASTATPPTISVSGNNTVCLGSSTDLTASGATNYTWSTGALTSTVNVLPSANTVYSVTGGVGSCTNTAVYSVTVDASCTDVWPGDANSDGIANNLDILEIGIQAGYTGPARTITGNNWVSCYANSWGGTITNGKNRCHADCNGDGIINNSDKLAVSANFNQVHSFKPSGAVPTTPDIYITPDQFTITTGNWGSASIYAGTSAYPMTFLYGLAFDINYDNTLIETDSVYLVYTSSFLNTGNNNIEFEKNIFANGTNYAATVRTSHININGFGKIATVHYKAKSGLSSDAVLNLALTNGYKINAGGGLTQLSGGIASLTVSTSAIGINEQELLSASINLFPQPASDNVVIRSSAFEESAVQVYVYDIDGKRVLDKKLEMDNGSAQLNVSDLSDGFYLLHLKTAEGKTAVKKLVVAKGN